MSKRQQTVHKSHSKLSGLTFRATGQASGYRTKYQYDSLNRRTRAALEDGSLWVYGYNDRDELTGARRYWPDWSPVAGQQFGYEYDNLGNRESADSGGDSSGANLRATSYTVNSLNQYTAISTPGYEDILGAALATNAVTVDGGTADRKGEYFHREIGVANGSGPVWQAVEVVSGGATNRGGLVFPDDNQALSYDLDGNLAFDGVWAYDWDGENRLRAMTMTNVSGIVASNRLRLEFVYDYLGRRVQKIVSTHSGGLVFVPQSTNRFVYDGWNVLTAVTPQLAPINSFLWGQDLSGTTDGAGGIGGLLLVTSHSAPATNCFVAYDGNGNVTALVRSGTDPVAARYEYSPFGEVIRATGPMAKANPFRWSTKCWDEEGGLVVYPKRAYSPSLGRWIGRDPISEEGGDNLYAYCVNEPIRGFDPMGMSNGTAADAEGAAAIGMGLFAAGTGWTLYTTVKQTVAVWNASQIAVYASSFSDPDDDSLEEGLAGMNISFAGQLGNKMPNLNDDRGGKDPRRSQTKGLNTNQNKLAEKAAKEARLSRDGKAMLKEELEKYSRGPKGDYKPLDYQTILRIARELANSAKYRLP